MENISYKYLNFIPFTNFDLWDVKRYLYNSNIKINAGVLLSDILYPYKKNISKDDVKQNKLRIIAKINFSGDLFLREFEEVETYKGNLYLVPKNAITYSKINVRHGCIYFNDSESVPFAVSNEYPIFKFDEDKVNGNFLQKLLRTKEFKKLLDTKTTGISKARVKQDEFLNIKIPLPSLAEQEAIVNAYENKINQADQLENQADQLEIEIENYLFSELGIEKPTPKKEKIKGLQFVQFKDLEKWGVDFVFQNKKNDLRYHTYKISDLCKISSGGTPSRNRKEYFEGNIPWIKTGELNNNILYDTEEKITNKAIQNSSAKLYKKGSLVMAMYGATIGKTAKLGVDATTNQACAVLFEINEKLVKVDFLWEFLQSQIHHFKAVAYGSAQPNLNAGIISNYQIPIPPLEKQQEIVDYISALKVQIKDKKNTAEQLKHQAQTDFENQIFS